MAVVINVVGRTNMADLSKASRALEQLRRDADKMSRGVAGSIQAAGRKLDQAGAKAARIGNNLSLAITGPLLLGANAAVDAASDLNESMNAVSKVFEEGTDKIHEFGKVAAEQAGLSQSAFNGLVTPVGAMLRNVGFGADEAATAAVEMTRRAADMASVFNTDVSDALGAIQAGLRGEADPLERFGVGLSAAAVTAHALELGLANTAAELSDNAKMQARMSLLMKQTERIAGDFADTSGEVANAERIMKAQAEDAAAALGQKLLPAKQKLIEVASGLIDKFNGLSSGQQDQIVKWGAIAAAAGPVLVVAGRLTQGIGKLIVGTGKLVGVTIRAAKALPALTRAVRVYGWAAGQAVKTLGTWIAAGARWAAQQIAAGARALASMAATAAQFVAHYVRMAAAALANAARMAASWIIAMGPVGWVIAAVVALAALIIANWDKVKRVTLAVWDWISSKISGVWRWVSDTTRNAVAAVVGFVTDLKDRGIALLGTLVGWIREYHPMAILWRIARDLVPKIVGFAGDIVDGIRTRFDRIVSVITGMPGRIARAARGMWDGITDAFKGAINAIIRGWNRLEFRVPGFKLGPISYAGFALGLPDIPQLAQGAIVKATPGGQVVNVGEGRRDEAIIPLPPGWRPGRGGGPGGFSIGRVEILVDARGADGNPDSIARAVAAGVKQGLADVSRQVAAGAGAA